MDKSTEDYDDEDFEDFDENGHPSPHKRSPKKSPQKKKKQHWADPDEDEDESGNGGENRNNVEGQDLESYMKKYKTNADDAASKESLACELRPLEGILPKKDKNAEEELLQKKFGYDFSSSKSYSSNQSSPLKGLF